MTYSSVLFYLTLCVCISVLGNSAMSLPPETSGQECSLLTRWHWSSTGCQRIQAATMETIPGLTSSLHNVGGGKMSQEVHAGPSPLGMCSCCRDQACWGYSTKHAWEEGAALTRCALPRQEVGRYSVDKVCAGLLQKEIGSTGTEEDLAGGGRAV